ncbi:MAG: DNA alkylation repair protein [Cytophagaceae bacterium]
MLLTAEKLIDDLNQHANVDRASVMVRFFKTGKGEYGEGDVFIGVSVPVVKKIAKAYARAVSLSETKKLLQHSIHEIRLAGTFILVFKFEKANNDSEKKEIVDFYLDNIHAFNNWDLIDASAHKILGVYWVDKSKDTLYALANSGDLWKQRIAIMATFYDIKRGEFKHTLGIAEILLHHPHDLIHKAVGWMLREVGKKNLDVELDFLMKHYRSMPRTMLRYAIEKFDPELRLRFLKGLV